MPNKATKTGKVKSVVSEKHVSVQEVCNGLQEKGKKTKFNQAKQRSVKPYKTQRPLKFRESLSKLHASKPRTPM